MNGRKGSGAGSGSGPASGSGTGGGSGPGGGQGGIPDGLVIGVIVFLLGMTLLVWTATGLSALLAHGAWPSTVSFSRTPTAMRHLIGNPHDIVGAWPDTPARGLSGYGLFWGLFIGQLLVLLVLVIFVMGTVARWRAVRARRREGVPDGVRDGVRDGARDAKTSGAWDREFEPRRQPWAAGPQPQPQQGERQLASEGRPTAAVPGAPRDVPASPHGLPTHEVSPHEVPAHDVPAPRREGLRPAPEAPGRQAAVGPGLVFAQLPERRPTAVQAVRDAEGPAVVVTSDPIVWEETKDARAKLGPVLLYDPLHLCDTPARLHWSPVAGCEDKATAASRAAALLAPVRPTAKIDQAVAEVAETLLRSYLHAAATDGRTIRHVHRWAQGSQVQDAVRTLRTHSKASSGAAGELESALTSYPERRDIAQELIGRALSSLSTVNVREACTPNRSDSLVLDSFVSEGGTLYVVGEPVEDPRTSPGAMPLLTALLSNVVEHGRRMAERSPAGRLDPPATLVLDDVAAVAPLPQLPELLSDGADRGLPTLALLRSREQLKARWPAASLNGTLPT